MYTRLQQLYSAAGIGETATYFRRSYTVDERHLLKALVGQGYCNFPSAADAIFVIYLQGTARVVLFALDVQIHVILERLYGHPRAVQNDLDSPRRGRDVVGSPGHERNDVVVEFLHFEFRQIGGEGDLCVKEENLVLFNEFHIIVERQD